MAANTEHKNWLRPSEALNRPLVRQTDDNAHVSGQIKTVRRLGFHIGNIGLLIARDVISELTDVNQICAIPNTAEWLTGIINLRGNLLPVFDINMLLGMEHTGKTKRMLLILGRGNEAGAIMIDDLPVQITFLEKDKLSNLPPLPAAIQPFAASGFEKNDEVWFNFDHQGFFESLAGRVTV